MFAAVTIAALPHHAIADDIADYLQQHGLQSLLAVHLEQQIERAQNNQEVADLVLRLAGVYAQMLETVQEPVQRQDLELRSRRLLDRAPPNSAEELRLALLRGSYRVAERIADNHRLRLASAEELEAARRTLADIIPQLASLRQRLKHDVEVAERRQSRAAGMLASALGEAAERTRNFYAQATFINAWALYYQSWLHQRNTEAREAEPMFGELLLAESPYPQPHEVSVDLRVNEAIARAILGLALCKSLTESSATAIAWLQLLEQEPTYEPLRAQAAVWKLVVHLEHREYQQVNDLLTTYDSRSDIPLEWLRLIAVHALEDSQRLKLADELARTAVLELASRGELQQVLDLANRYGAEALGRSGFALQYVHGVIAYQHAREAHGSDTPMPDQPVAAQYRAAAEQLRAALKESDAGNYSGAVASCRRLIAWCLYFQGQFLSAHQAFVEAASSAIGAEAEESLWMAIVSLDKIVGHNAQADLQSQLRELMQRFVQQFPASEHVPMLQLRLAASAEQPSDAVVDQLLSIPPGTQAYESAQRRAADLLYQMFRAASSPERLYYANRFFAVALGLLDETARQYDLGQPDGSQVFITRCRQVLEVAFAEGIDHVQAGVRALQALDSLRAEGVDLAEFEDELDFRRVQQRLVANELAAAAEIANAMWARQQSSNWTRLASRAIFRHAHRIWKDDQSSLDARVQALDMVIRFGGRVLLEYRDAADPLSQPGALAYHAAVAEATMQVWEQTGDAEKGRAALFLYDKLLAHQPRNATFLRSVAILADRLGDSTKSLDCWRRLVAGLPVGSGPWYEAKFHQIELLQRIDPQRAREVMDQHKQLYPDYGPDPWGGKLKALDQSIA